MDKLGGEIGANNDLDVSDQRKTRRRRRRILNNIFDFLAIVSSSLL
jgi:hypothetical protein